jgi:hypothetical protein
MRLNFVVEASLELDWTESLVILGPDEECI